MALPTIPIPPPFYLFILLFPPLCSICFLLLQPPKATPPPSTLNPILTITMPENQNQGEVMWPRLVFNKLLRRPRGSYSFIADFPSTEMQLEVASLDDPISLNRRSNDQMDAQKYKLFVSTWNIGGIPPPDDLNLEDWLDTKNNSYDIYVLGFQEIVPLSARNILGPEKSTVAKKWNSLITATLNNSQSSTQRGRESKQGEKQKLHPVKQGTSEKSIMQDIRCIISKQMVGILVSVWVRGDLRRYIRHPSVSSTGCGVMGLLGNKGAVSVRFCLHETSFCFVCCHLASGGKEEDAMHRNSDAMQIFTRTSFPRRRPSLDLPQKILDHDRIIMLGDLNYRISLPEDKTRTLVEQKEWNILLEKDQLRGEVSEGRAFEGWHEGAIAFSPTYKYYPNSDAYHGCIQRKKGEKRRAPAWCDRILWRGKGLKQNLYDRCESRLSDHRPVRAIFTAVVDVPRTKNSLRSFFLSDRLDQIASDFDCYPMETVFWSSL
ncbi:type IV inositol polyphosphate 5-phosphatase 9-like [Phoenix dactylifera]|uniref:Type IV inositol polyphosphate 5-phosphatase 9-like n=1 Tax=Phoenix dactylifera TaxID=42345 RepID=A0A8B7CG44_PHODC|nr:type IV inositol polyphosphate 5-phosphatase 9-like [Phoenix dactylifera]